jgi:ABC-2 type transport system permease protein
MNNTAKKYILQLTSAMAIILLAGYFLSFINWRIDLTQEKRYSLNPVSKTLLEKLPDGIIVTVYLDGDMPLGFKRLSNSAEQLLDQFSKLSNNHINYRFIDPMEDSNPEVKRKLIGSLYDKGLQPTNVKMKDEKGNLSEKLIIPGAILTYKDKEIAANLLLKSIGTPAEVNLNNSIQALEYTLINAMTGLTKDSVDNIAFIEGHGELDDYQTADITREMEMNLRYHVFRGKISNTVSCLNPYKVLIIAKPQQPFTETEKFVLDQYLMNGGKIIWLIDQTHVNLDSMYEGSAFAYINNLNLDDQLFRYGIRINPKLIQDVQCALIPVNIALQGEQAKFVPAPFYYLPLITPSDKHPISRNLNLVRCEFANTIDTVGNNDKVKKTVLLSSSTLSRTISVPAMISLREVKHNLTRNDFNKPLLTTGLLLEGCFESNFKNRMLNDFNIQGEYTLRPESKPTKMIVIADGDVIKNNVRQSPKGTQIMPLGFDRYSNQTYGNKEFLMNAINYLTDDAGLLSLRNRDVKLRLLDKTKIRDEKLKWKLINTLLPFLLVCLAGFVVNFLRKKRFA